MYRRTLATYCALTAMIAAVSLLPPPAFAQSSAASDHKPTLPRTPWGDPDLQGMWVNNNATSLERPKEFAGKQTLSEAELAELKEKAAAVVDGGDAFFGDDFIKAAVAQGTEYRSFDQKTGNYNQFWIAEREIENRTSLIVDPPDGRLPPLTPEGQQRRATATSNFLGNERAGPEDLNLAGRCITYGMPYIQAGYNSYSQILQAPGYVVILQEMIHDARIIPLDGRPHLPGQIRQWHGDPRGRWEGDTLVVESTNFSPKSQFRGTAENLHLTERFTRTDAETIAFEFTVDDPTTYTDTWTAMIPLKKSSDAIFEYACHEGNISMEGVLRGARALEQAAAEAGESNPN